MMRREGNRFAKRVAAGLAAGMALASLVAGGARAETLRVFAAASLTEAFSEIGKTFEAGHPSTTVELYFAGSQVLRTQIEQGARADVFAPADRVHSRALEQQGLLGEVRVFAHNLLVIVTPADRARVVRLADLARPEIRIVVASPAVPAGRYANDVLRKMAASDLYGKDYLARVQGNIASLETNVRAVLAKVALGEADAGFVYRTDAATAARKIMVIAIPERLNAVADYPIGVVAGSTLPALASEFVVLTLGPRGQAILEKHGFLR